MISHQGRRRHTAERYICKDDSRCLAKAIFLERKRIYVLCVYHLYMSHKINCIIFHIFYSHLYTHRETQISNQFYRRHISRIAIVTLTFETEFFFRHIFVNLLFYFIYFAHNINKCLLKVQAGVSRFFSVFYYLVCLAYRQCALYVQHTNENLFNSCCTISSNVFCIKKR